MEAKSFSSTFTEGLLHFILQKKERRAPEHSRDGPGVISVLTGSPAAKNTKWSEVRARLSVRRGSVTSKVACTASLLVTTVCDHTSLRLRGQKMHGGAQCSHGNVYTWAGNTAAHVACMGGQGVKRNTAMCSCLTGAEEDREMEVYQQGLRTGKLNQCQVSGRHLVPSLRTGVLPKGCTGLG